MNDQKINLRYADIVMAALMLLLAGGAFYITTTWLPPVLPGDPGAAFFPRIAIGIIVVFSLLLVMRRLRSLRPSLEETGASNGDLVTVDVGKFIFAFVTSIALVAAIAYVGFELPAVIFMAVLLGWSTQRWLLSIVGAVVSVVVMWFVFVILLRVRLPLEFLPTYLNMF